MKKQVLIRLLSVSTAIFLCAVSLGCSSSTTTTKTTVRSEPAYSDHYDDHHYHEGRTTTETTETVQTDESDVGCGGVLGCTVEVVGSVLALPFRAVGFLIDAIF